MEVIHPTVLVALRRRTIRQSIDLIPGNSSKA